MPPPQTQEIDDKIRALADLTTGLAQDIARKHTAIKRAADDVLAAINAANLPSSEARAYTTRLNHAWVPYRDLKAEQEKLLAGSMRALRG